LYNSSSPEGAQIASYYAQVHPGARQLALTGLPADEQVTWDVYLDIIRPQVLAGLDSSVDCIVTTKGLPLRIYNPRGSGSWNEYSSLESELARVDTVTTRTLMGNQAYLLPAALGGNPLALNPYYYAGAAFSYGAYGMRLTARLDGFSVSDVKAAVDGAQRAVVGRPGYAFLVDDDPNAPASSADKMQNLSSNVLAPRGVPYGYDATDAFLRDAAGPVIGYVSHGVHGGAPGDYVLNSQTGLRFVPAPGAVFHTWESFNAWTFDLARVGQMPQRQGLLAEWLRLGGAVGTGHVQEPGASAFNVANEDRMFEMLLSGYSWVESAWNATNQLSFVNTVVGDPLMRLRQWAPGDCDLDGDVDMIDVSMIEAAYGSTLGDGRYTWRADMNADGSVNNWDLEFIRLYYTAPPDGSEGAVPIPEPGCLVLLVLSALLPPRRRRRL
jgi:uncharacterized protein (TIGR03790 family)